MSFTVNNRSTPAAGQQTTATAGSASGSFDTSQMLSAKELTSGGGFKIGVNKDSKPEQLAEAFQRFSDNKSVVGYAQMASQLGKEFQGKMLDSVEKKMNKFLADKPNASKTEIAEFAKKTLLNDTVMYQTMKQTITQMANDAISRMKDTFEG
jgi:hypothetical protein